MEKVKSRLLSSEELLILQAEERSILSEIDRICNKHKINYYIVGGSLLGAVRHGGFIPWDDDIDIAMYRKDFKRFQKICETELGNEFFLQTIKTDPCYWQIMPKVRKNDTLLESVDDASVNMHKGVFVDIFLLDFVSNDKFKTKIKHDIHWFFITLLSRKQMHNIENSIKCFIVDKIPIKLILSVDEFIIRGEREKKFTVNYSSIYGYKKQTFPTAYYGEGVTLKFDDLTVKAPTEYIKMLETIYGDYMKLPPIEKRGNHHKIYRFEVKNKNEKI